MDRGERVVRPVAGAKTDKRNIIVIILIVVIVLVIIGALGYFLFFRSQSDASINQPGTQIPCSSNLDCAVDEVCSIGFCKKIGCSVPQSPDNLVVSQIGSNKVQLQWNASQGATAYRVYIGPTSNFTQFQATDVIPVGSTTLITELALNVTWYFFVVAVNDCGESNPSNRTSLLLEFKWPSPAFNIVKIPDPQNEFGTRGGIKFDISDPFVPVLTNRTECNEFDNTYSFVNGCTWLYNETTHEIQLSDTFGNPAGECIGSEPFDGQFLGITQCGQFGLFPRKWIYVPVSQAICLEDYPNLCITSISNGSLGLTVNTADGGIEQKWGFIPTP